MPQRFDIDYRDPTISFDPLIDEVFEELQSSFLEMPKGNGFTDYQTFEAGYQSLKRFTRDFTDMSVEGIEAAVLSVPVAFVVFRSILGFTPPEWAYVTTERTGIKVDQGAARTIDRNVRLHPVTPRGAWSNGLGDLRMRAMIRAGIETLATGIGSATPGLIHRLDKVDTRNGIPSVQHISALGVPYAVLLYERFLGRPFSREV